MHILGPVTGLPGKIGFLNLLKKGKNFLIIHVFDEFSSILGPIL